MSGTAPPARRDAAADGDHLRPASAPGGSADDDVLVALEGLVRALDDNIQLARRSKRRARHIMQQRARGRTYREIVPGHGEPLIVEMMRDSLSRLSSAASELQHAQAKALYEEGLTMEEVGRLFGVTHQRVSAMLKRARQRGVAVGRVPGTRTG